MTDGSFSFIIFWHEETEKEQTAVKYIYIVNRFQTKDRTDELIRKLEKVSREMDRDFEIRVYETPEEAGTIRKDYRYTEHILTAIGGDGSINCLLNDIADTHNILSFIPSGTGNDFYRAVAQSIPAGIHRADIVRINERYFINAACFGIDADIANDESFIHNKFIPKSMRFNASVIRHFLSYRKGRFLKVECNGGVYEREVTTVVAANSQYYGGGYRISPESRIDDGKMELYIFDHMNRPKMAKTILSMKSAGHLNSPALKRMQTNRAVITASEPFQANIDGEALLSDRFDIELIPAGIRLEYNPVFVESILK